MHRLTLKLTRATLLPVWWPCEPCYYIDVFPPPWYISNSVPDNRNLCYLALRQGEEGWLKWRVIYFLRNSRSSMASQETVWICEWTLASDSCCCWLGLVENSYLGKSIGCGFCVRVVVFCFLFLFRLYRTREDPELCLTL